MDLSSLPLIPARLRSGTRRSTRLIVIHTAECGERKGAARGVASWFQNPAARGSAHATVDADEIVQHMGWDEKAAHARGGDANATGVGIEHAGRASQTAAEWGDDYSRRMLERSAALVAELCARYGIPPVRLTPAQVAAGEHGICGHADVTAAYAVRGGHTDPGPDFPWDRYMSMVRGAGWQAVPDPQALPEGVPVMADLRRSLDRAKKQVVKRGDKGEAVRWVQALLGRHKLAVRMDDSFGPATAAAVRMFQQRNGLKADGVVGPRTWAALDR
jgi:N-acetyl-anhydromuramyl-L-alanine amidase AmpD